jgi:hypothetical protein
MEEEEMEEMEEEKEEEEEEDEEEEDTERSWISLLAIGFSHSNNFERNSVSKNKTCSKLLT